MTNFFERMAVVKKREYEMRYRKLTSGAYFLLEHTMGRANNITLFSIGATCMYYIMKIDAIDCDVELINMEC